MDTEVDLTTVDRAVLIASIAQLQATVLEQQRVIERLERRIAELEGQAKPGGPPRMPGLKAKSGGQPPVKQQPRKQRRHGFARRRMTPTQRVEHVRVEHVMENGPDCGTHLTGGWTQRTREVIELPVAPVRVTEHVYIARTCPARTCPACRRRCTPPAGLDGVVLGRQRRGVNVLSLVATLREEARMPFRTIQRYLDTVQQRRVSAGAIVGANGYVWTFSTPTERYFLRRGRGKTVVDEALSDAFSGVLVSDCYAAYHHYDGPKQRCWAHLLRDIHDLQSLYPEDESLSQWSDAVHGIYDRAKAFTHPQTKRRRSAQLALERRLLALCRPFRNDPLAVQARLCRRMENHIKELFVFVAEPAAPPDNNAAERSLRHLVVSRKVSGGTRSEQGTQSKMTLASIFGAWRAQGQIRSPPAVNCSFPRNSELLQAISRAIAF